MMQRFRLPDRPKPLAEVADRFHLTPLIRAMTSPHDAFLLALSEERVRSPARLLKLAACRDQGRAAVEKRRRGDPAPLDPRACAEGPPPEPGREKILIHQYAHRVDHALHSVLAGRDLPLVLAAAEPLASIFRTVNTYPRLVDDMIAGSPDHVTDAQLADAALPILDRLYRRELEAVIALFDELKPRTRHGRRIVCGPCRNRRRDSSTCRGFGRRHPRLGQRCRRQRHLFDLR